MNFLFILLHMWRYRVHHTLESCVAAKRVKAFEQLL